jgi:hypothetical protein
MPTTTRLLPLSGSPLGLPMLIAPTASPGTALHQVSSSTNDTDRLTLKLHNFADSPLNFFVQIASVQFTFKDIPSKAAEYVVIDGMPLVGAASPTIVYGWGSAGYAFLVTGDVIRVTQT